MSQLRTLLETVHRLTVPLRPGEAMTKTDHGSVNVVEIFDMPSVEDPRFESWSKVDYTVIQVAVDPKAQDERNAIREAFINVVHEHPALRTMLKNGPSYMHMGFLMEQQTTLRLFALGHVLGLWHVVTPATLKLTPEKREELFRGGFTFLIDDIEKFHALS